MRKTDTSDPVLAAEVERATEPYRRLFPAEVVTILEEILEHALTTHPVGAELLDRVRPRAARKESGSEPKHGAAASVPVKKTGAK